MNVVKWTIGLAVLAMGGAACGQSTLQSAFDYNPYNLASCAEETDEPAADCADDCDTDCADDIGCCDGVGCGDCGGGGGCGLFGPCCLGEPWTLKDWMTPCCDTINYGGWFSMGYLSNNERLSFVPGDELSFGDVPDKLNLNQAWFYIERLAEAPACGWDWGYRFDIMYGTDAHAAQSYGNPRALDGPNLGAWDASLDNGIYGWAMPQLYGEVAYGDWSWKIGHWFTPVGYEVIPDTGNFFRTHTLTHYNSEPFTHTGALGTYSGYEEVTLIAGWALGWDTGFEQFDGGNIFIGGFTANMTENIVFTYMTTAGNLGWRSGGQDAYTQHIVMSTTLSENMTWVAQSDYLNSNGVLNDPTFKNEDGGLTNYLFYTLNDCWRVGGRLEWWKTNNITGSNTSFYDATVGLNYKPQANLTIRPEVRYDWTPSDEAAQAALDVGDYNQWLFSIDAVLTY